MVDTEKVIRSLTIYVALEVIHVREYLATTPSKLQYHPGSRRIALDCVRRVLREHETGTGDFDLYEEAKCIASSLYEPRL